LPKGSGAVRGIGEKFSTNPASGTGSLSVPIAISPARPGFELDLELSYDSGAGNGPFGIGWRLSTPAITRKTDKGLPRYLDAQQADTFVLSGAEDLVPVPTPDDAGDAGHVVQRYRPRVEGLFARIERWTRVSDGDVHWRATTRDNALNIYGRTPDARIADPRHDRSDPMRHPAVGRDARVFSWLLEETRDDRGNVVRYEYKGEDGAGVAPRLSEMSRFRVDEHGVLVRDGGGNPIFEATAQRYLERIRYGNRAPVERDEAAPSAPAAWLFEVVFDYGEYARPDDDDAHATRAPRPESPTPSEPLGIEGAGTWGVRADPFSTYRAGFEVRTYRLCRRALVFHRFPAGTHGLEISPCLVRSTDLGYAQGPYVSYLETITQAGYLWNGANDEFDRATMPSLALGYSKSPEALDETLRSLDAASLEGIPSGVDGSFHQWVDLDGEGLPGVLTAQQRSWYYKRNEGDGQLAPPRELRSVPSPGELGRGAQLTDLGGDGQLDLVSYASPLAGYFSRTEEGGWEPFEPFSELPNIDWSDPNLRFVDLDGDGNPDVLVTEDDAFVWYRSRAKQGFEPAALARKPRDECQGPAVVFADGTQTIFLADMSGDGLTDIVRVRSSEVCYWPNVGHGRFGRKITFESCPRFDTVEQFDPRRIRFADIDGSGVSDILYLARDGVAVYLNQAGNALSGRKLIGSLPPVDDSATVSAVDLLGQGTSCLVWSSHSPADRTRPVIYVDPLGSMPAGQRKPHLLTSIVNNLGAETRIAYASSTRFYLDDRRNGRAWLTRLAFPVQVIERTERVDHVNRSRLVTRFAYHHGYFDGYEQELRGFACVEQWDAESFGADRGRGLFPDLPYDTNPADDALDLPPVRTVTWFHTGAWLERERLERELAREYYAVDLEGPLLVDTVVPAGLSIREEREAARALRGRVLRQEIYAEDGTPASVHPYSVSERSYELRLIQHARDDDHAILFAHPRETIDLHYERDPTDPRMQHQLVLEVDDFGNTTRAVVIGYPRRASRRQAEEAATGRSLPEQARLWATISDASFINAAEERTWYRVGVPVETATWELTGLVAPEQQSDSTAPATRWRALSVETVRAAVMASLPIPFEQSATAGFERRLVEAKRLRYVDDSLGPLPIGETGSRGLQHESYRLALTDGLVSGVLDHDIGAHQVRIDPQWLRTECRYAAGSEVPVAAAYTEVVPPALRGAAWWAQSGHIVYDDPVRARQLFYLPEKAVDPFGNEHATSYDAHLLLVRETRDPAGNTTRSDNDYRLLAPWLLTDPNGNRSAVAFDTLGMVVRSAVMGKAGAGEGDTLADPTMRMEYDLHRRQPEGKGRAAFVKTLTRERHGDPDTRWQVSYSYSDGSGREVMRKVQAEPGPAPLFDADGVLERDANGAPRTHQVDERWLGTGRVVFDNKGNAIKRYEPFFWDAPDFNDEDELVEWGVTPLIRYDPLSRVVRTDQPNGSFARVLFDAWCQASWDENDNVLESEWYARRGSPSPSGPEPRAPAGTTDPETLRTVAETRAAWLAAKHAGTPTLSMLDSLGRSFLSIAHNRVEAAGATIDTWLESRSDLDIEGNQRSVTDARGVVVLRQDFDVAGRVLHSSSPDGGDRWSLLDCTDKPVRRWDSRKHRFRSAYDALRRPTHLWVGTGDEPEVLVQRTLHGDVPGSPGESKNLRGKVYRDYDGAGLVTCAEYDFKGNPTETTRQFARVYRDEPDWTALSTAGMTVGDIAAAAAPMLEAETFTIRTRYDALGRVVSRLTPDGSETLPSYNESNLLERLEARVRGAAATLFIENIDYNERGQRTLATYANGTRTEYTYDALTFRLTEMRTLRGAAVVLQGLVYTDDAVGNITEIGDASEQPIFFGGDVVEARGRFRYDALYRLVQAEGREHPGQQPAELDVPRSGIPHPNDVQALRRYTERYFYDDAGNIERLVHDTSTSGWTRYYAYESAADSSPLSNRLLCSSLAGDVVPTDHPHSATETSRPYSCRYDHDAHGNMTRMPHLAEMRWDHADRLVAVDLGGGGDAFYGYDTAGSRVRQVIEKSGIVEERRYFGGYEIFRKYVGAGLHFERATLAVSDEQRKVCLVETTLREDGTAVAAPTSRRRFQLDNHLGSSLLEVDHEGSVISYEEYYAFGGTAYHAVRSGIEVSDKRYRYTGKERDEGTGLYYYGARYYIAWLGRWSAADPTGLVDGLNVFAYVRGSPINRRDVGGRFSWDPAALGDAIDARITAAEHAAYAEDKNVWTSLYNTAVATGATVAKGATSILRVGTGSAQGVEDIERGLSAQGDGWDVAIGVLRMVSDAGEIAGAATGIAGTSTKMVSSVKVVTKTRAANALRKEAEALDKTSTAFKKTAEKIGELESDISAAKAGLSEVKNVRRTTKSGSEAVQGIDKAYVGPRDLNPFSKGPKRQVAVVEAKGTSAPRADPLDHLGETKSFGTQMSDSWVSGNLDKAAKSGSKGAVRLMDDLAGNLPDRYLQIADTGGGSSLYSLSGQGDNLTSSALKGIAPTTGMTWVPELTLGLQFGAQGYGGGY
jgi:RHS repeat-associated protein